MLCSETITFFSDTYIEYEIVEQSVEYWNNTGCSTRYRTRHFFNNSNTNEDFATRFEQEYVRCVRNEEEYFCSVYLFRLQYLHWC